MGLRYKTLVDGGRQVVNFIFPGDFIGLQAGILGEMQHSVEATTRMVLCVFDRKEIWSLYRNYPERAFDLTWLAAMEEHFLGETLSMVGQQPAIERIAWALLRMFRRGQAQGLVKDAAMALPYRQQDLADAVGLSLVHTNKMLARLRAEDLATWEHGVLHVPDLKGLAARSGTDGEREMRRPLI